MVQSSWKQFGRFSNDYWVIIWPSKLSPSCISNRNENTCEGRNRDADGEQTCGHGEVVGTECRKNWESGIDMYTLLLLLLLSRFSRVRLCATPRTAAHQAPPSLGFSGQEHWSGLPFPSPIHESERGKGSCSVMSDTSWPHGLKPTRLLCPWDFPGKSTGVGCHCLLWCIHYCM